MERYALEFLSAEFEKHMKCEGASIGFNLPKALKSIVDEIIELKLKHHGEGLPVSALKHLHAIGRGEPHLESLKKSLDALK